MSGWLFVIVALIIISAVLYDLGIFNPQIQQSITTGVVTSVALNSDQSSTHTLSYIGSHNGFSYSASESVLYNFDLTNTNGKTIEISSFWINVNGFSVTSASPSLPLEITPGQTEHFTISINPPAYSYNGTIALVYNYTYVSSNKAL